jgi:hypothetical protein
MFEQVPSPLEPAWRADSALRLQPFDIWYSGFRPKQVLRAGVDAIVAKISQPSHETKSRHCLNIWLSCRRQKLLPEIS